MKARIEFLGFKIASFISYSLPRDWSIGFIRFLLKNVINYRKELIHYQLKNAFPTKSQEELLEISSRYYSHLASVIVESLSMYSSNKKADTQVIYSGLDSVNDSLKNGKSVMLLGGHTGNWEMVVAQLSSHTDGPCLCVYQPLKNPYIDAKIRRKRNENGAKVLKAFELIRELVADQDSSNLYFALIDQSPQQVRDGKWKNFLNSNTLFSNTFPKMCSRYGLAPYYVSSFSKDNGNYHCHITKLDETAILESYVQHLENSIKEKPYNWLWSHNRWKHSKDDDYS